MGKGTIVGDAIGSVLSVFGLDGRNETFTDIQVTNLLTLGVAGDGARRTAKYNSFGNLQQYHLNYRAFQREYRRKYSKRFLQNVGYDPSSTATTRVIIPALVESYLESVLGYVDIDIGTAKDLYMNSSQKCNYSMHQLVGYNFATGKVEFDGKEYALTSCDDVSATEVTIVLTRDKTDTIVDNLTTNYAYDGSNVVINGEAYSADVVGSTNGSGTYETTCVHIPVDPAPQLPDEVISTIVDSITRNYTNLLFDDEVVYVEYVVTSGEVGTEKRYFISAADTLPVYGYATVDVTTIIPMKEDNVIINETTSLSNILRKLGLGYDMLIGSLKNPDMDSAYLMTGLDPRVNNDAHNKLLFKMFDLVAPGNGDITVAISRLNMNYSFTMVKSTVTGSIGPLGTYTRLGQTNTGVTLRFQGSPTQYQQLVISSFNQRYTISGQTINTNLTADTCRLVIPLDLFNELRYREWVDVYERSLCMLGYATETVYVEWYERSIFGFFLKIVAVVILIWSWGAAKDISAFLWGLAVSLAVAFTVNLIAQVIGGTLGAIVAATVAIYLTVTYSLPVDASTTQIWLQGANTGLSVINQSIQHELATITAEGNSYLSSIQDKLDDIKEKSEEFQDDVYNYGFASFSNIGKANPLFQTTEEYVSSIVNTESLVDGGWMYNIEAQIAQRNQVYV